MYLALSSLRPGGAILHLLDKRDAAIDLIGPYEAQGGRFQVRGRGEWVSAPAREKPLLVVEGERR